MDENALQKAVEIAGGKAALARTVGVTYQAVQQWVASGRCPPTRVLAIEKATRGEVSRHDLRPDIYPETRQ